MNENEIAVGFTVQLNTPKAVKDFCNISSTLPRTITMKSETSSRIVDCKSILGVLSLNLSNPIEVIVKGKTTLSPTEVTNMFKPWIVKE